MIGLLIALGLGTAVPLHGQERSLAIERFDAAITVNRDGTIDVVETITARFAGSWNGLFRTIPVEYRTPQGFNWTIRLDFIDATDEQGRVLKTEAARERHYLKYKAGPRRSRCHQDHRPPVPGQERAAVFRGSR